MLEQFGSIVDFLDSVAYWGPSAGGERISLIVLLLLGTGLFLSIRLGFLQFRALGHGFAVTSGRYDDSSKPGDVSHFQALTTALSATVGIGNIAGVALAIHWGGPGAMFWMWVTALVGMVTKYSEVTLAQRYRVIEKPDTDAKKWEGSVSGGPMYYIEKGLVEVRGEGWRKPAKILAVFFAVMLMLTSFLTGNAVQANTVADQMNTFFGMPNWVTGLITATVVALVILGGISRIGKVTGVLAPVMAGIYVTGALAILFVNYDQVFPSLGLILTEAFSPSAGVAGTGAGAFLLTMMWGVRRGLFSNEAGQGSAPIAHAAAKTQEPVSEGVVALLEPFIDTIIICTLTGLVILTTGVWNDRVPTPIELGGGDLTFVDDNNGGVFSSATAPEQILVLEGVPQYAPDGAKLAWHEVAVQQFYTDLEQTIPFSGTISPSSYTATADDGTEYTVLYGDAVESGAPLTSLAFSTALGDWASIIVVISVLLFAISTAISWSYYGDRCANYLFGTKAILPYKAVFVIMHFVGATVPLATIWALGDVFLGFVTFPNLLALLLLSGMLTKMTRDYFERKPWLDNS